MLLEALSAWYPALAVSSSEPRRHPALAELWRSFRVRPDLIPHRVGGAAVPVRRDGSSPSETSRAAADQPIRPVSVISAEIRADMLVSSA